MENLSHPEENSHSPPLKVLGILPSRACAVNFATCATYNSPHCDKTRPVSLRREVSVKFSINRTELANALSIVLKGVSTRSTLPVLSGV